MHADPESISTPRARLEDFGVDPGHETLKAIEKSLVQLETDALGVIRTLVYAVSKAKPNVQVTRRQLNTLHRYLFLMWCRHTDRPLQLSQLDDRTKQALDAHVASAFGKRPAVQPLDVWLQNARQILDDKFVDIFTDEKIFLPDRQAFEDDCRSGRLALWRSAPDVDFITSMNAFAVYDGWPVDAALGGGGGAHATLLSLQHGSRAVFARVKVFPVHPNLALAILDPSLTSGVNPGAHYDTLLSRGSSQFAGFPAFAPDIRYANLSPAARKAQRTGDTKMLESGGKKTAPTGGRRIDGRLLETREDDMYTFSPATLSARQTLLVNSLVLHTAADTLVFRSTRQLHHSLSAYSKDFTSWSPKRDFSRLQDVLRRHEAGLPIPDEPSAPLALSPAEMPMSPALEPLDRPTTPSVPGSPRLKSRRQKRREWMERKRLRDMGIGSPSSLGSPVTSEAELSPDDRDDYIGSPLSDMSTLVEGSPVMQSIEAAMGSPLIKGFKLDGSHSGSSDEKARSGSDVEEMHLERHEPEVERVETAAPALETLHEEPETMTIPVAEVPAVHIVEPTPDTESPLGDVFTEEEASAVLEEARHLPPSQPVSEAAEDEREVALATTAILPRPEELNENMIVTEFPAPHPYQPDGVLQGAFRAYVLSLGAQHFQGDAGAEEPDNTMSYLPPTFNDDPFDDAHEVVLDQQEGAHAIAVDTAVHSRLHGMHISPSISPQELEALAEELVEEEDIATAGQDMPPPLTRAVPLVRVAAVEDSDDEGDSGSLSGEETTSRFTRSASASASEHGADDEEKQAGDQRFMEHLLPPPIPDLVPALPESTLEIPTLEFTPPTPAMRTLPDMNEKQVPNTSTVNELRNRTGLAGLQNEEKTGNGTVKAPAVAVAPQYTWMQSAVVMMVLLFLMVFAFPYIAIRVIVQTITGRRDVAAVEEVTTTATSPSQD